VFVRGVSAVFWFAFLADALFSVLDGAFGGFQVARIVTNVVLVLLSLLAAGTLVFTPRAPGKALIPLILFTWWTLGAQAAPLDAARVPHLALVLGGIQVALAAAVLILFRSPRAAWYVPFAGRDRPPFSWRHSLIAVPLAAIVFVACTLVGVFSGLSSGVKSLTGGYVRLHPDGIYVVERQFRSGDREVRLTGMVHVAEDDFYSSILPPSDPSVPSVVLVEGVTDSKSLLTPGSLRYSKLASLLSITSQDQSSYTTQVIRGLRREGQMEEGEGPPPEEPGAPEAIDFRHADVDVATFDPKTLAFIAAVMTLFQADDWRHVVSQLTDPASPLNDAPTQSQAMKDILYHRNEQLISQIKSSLKDYRRVIVPWGALHLPGIETWLRSQHFEKRAEVERKAIGFW